MAGRKFIIKTKNSPMKKFKITLIILNLILWGAYVLLVSTSCSTEQPARYTVCYTIDIAFSNGDSASAIWIVEESAYVKFLLKDGDLRCYAYENHKNGSGEIKTLYSYVRSFNITKKDTISSP